MDPQREFAPSILDVLSVIYINSHLPQERRLRWRLLFATELHGNSFAQLCGRRYGGPCLVLLEDCDGHVFEGLNALLLLRRVKPQFQVNSPTLVAQDSWRFWSLSRHVGTSGSRQPVCSVSSISSPKHFF